MPPAVRLGPADCIPLLAQWRNSSPCVGHNAVRALLIAPVDHIHPCRDVTLTLGHRDILEDADRVGSKNLTHIGLVQKLRTE